jgi:hypothetical protein
MDLRFLTGKEIAFFCETIYRRVGTRKKSYLKAGISGHKLRKCELTIIVHCKMQSRIMHRW